MALNLSFVVFFLLFMVLALGLGYLLARRLLGPQAARRNLLYAGPWTIFGALLAIFLSFAGRYGLVALYGIYALGIFAWLLSWPRRKQRAGKLLLQVGRTAQNKMLFWVGLLQVGLAIAMTLFLLDGVLGGLVVGTGIAAGIAQIAFWWSMALLFVGLGRSNLEIRENGLSYLYAWQPWERVQAFGWDDDKPNTLILKVLPRSFVSRKFMTLNIPTAQQETVDRLLEDYLPETDLATEMDDATGGNGPSKSL